MKQLMRSRLRRHGGFSLTELLLTTLILVMVAGVVAAGIPAAARAYTKAVDAANAQVLLSTTMTELRDEVGTARDPDSITVDGQAITFTSAKGIPTNITCGDKTSISISGSANRYLVSDKAATKNLYTQFGSVSYENGVVTFNNLGVYKDGSPVVTVSKYQIKLVNYIPPKTGG